MSKCKITVLLQSALHGRLCFNPLITIDEQATVAELQAKALTLYAKKANFQIAPEDVISITTQNAGVESCIADDSDAVIDVLGTQSTITLLVKDAKDVMPHSLSMQTQLHTPLSSTAPSLEFGPPPSSPAAAYSSPKGPKKKKKDRANRKRKWPSVDGSPGTAVTADLPAKKRRKPRISGQFSVPDHVASKGRRTNVSTRPRPSDNLGNSIPRAEKAEKGLGEEADTAGTEDGFQFTRPETATTDAVISKPRELPPTTVSKPLALADSHASKTPVERSTSIGAVSTPLTEANLQLVTSWKQARKDESSDRAISVASSSIHSSHILGHLVDKDKPASPDRIPQTQELDLVIDRSVGAPTSPRPVDGATHDSDASREDNLRLEDQSSQLDAKSITHPPPTGATRPSAMDAISDTVAATADTVSDVSESELADYLSSASEDSLHEDEVTRTASAMKDSSHSVAGVSSSVAVMSKDEASDDSSSMQSAHFPSSDDESTSDDRPDEPHTSTTENTGDVKEQLPDHGPSFQNLSRATPEPSQQTAPLPDLESDEVRSSHNTSPSKSSAIRPGLKSNYKSLSFLHEEARREKDDMTKLASPLKTPSNTRALPTMQDPRPSSTDVQGNDDDDDETDDSSSTSSSDDDGQNNLPPHKRARAKATRSKTKKRQSQGAKAFMRGLF